MSADDAPVRRGGSAVTHPRAESSEGQPQVDKTPRAAKPGVRERVRRTAASVPLALVLVLTAAVGLRIFAMDAYRPAVMTMSDSTAYVWAAAGDLYGDAVRPAGYSVFLRSAHEVSADLRFTIGLQHLFGLLSAVLVYLTTRRLGGSGWLSLFPAAVVALSGDQVMLEHVLLSESLFMFLLCAAVYAAIRMLDGNQPLIWGAGSGLLIAGATTVRTVALVLVPLLALWAVLCIPGSWRLRLGSGAATLVAGCALLSVYAGFQNEAVGTWSLSRTSGWAFYGRVAPFADCSEFTPPRGTTFLCEKTPPGQRPGPEYYGWIGGPAREEFGGPPAGNGTLRRFAAAVILHQPLDYLRAVAKDTVRYFVPSFGFDRPSGGVGPELFLFDRRAPGYEEKIEQVVESYYDDFTLRLSPGGVRALTDYQELVRVHGILLLEFLILGLAGFILARGRQKKGLLLMNGVVLTLLVLPAATTVYSGRYAIPIEGLSAAAAAMGGSLIISRLRGRTGRPAPEPQAD